jgi:O-antigen ligase
MRTIAFYFSLVLVFMIPWEDAVTVIDLGSLPRVVGLFVVAVWAATFLVTGRHRNLHPFHFAAYFFILWNIASIFWSFGFEETVQRILTYAQLFGLTVILWDLYTTPDALRAGLQAYILGAYVAIGSTVLNYLAGQEAYRYSGGRYAGAGLNANDLALILALGLPVAWHLAISAAHGGQSRILRLVDYAYIPASLFAILLTGTRTALFAILPALVFILGTFTRLRLSTRVFVFAALAGALFTLASQIPQTTLDRLATTGTSLAALDAGGRVEIWRYGTAVFPEHPLLGVGSGAFPEVNLLHAIAHNTFLSVLVELGIVGFVLFSITLGMAVFRAIRQFKWDSGLWLTVLLVWAVGAFTLTWEARKPTWLFLIFVVVSASLYNQRDESSVSAPDHWKLSYGGVWR